MNKKDNPPSSLFLSFYLSLSLSFKFISFSPVQQFLERVLSIFKNFSIKENLLFYFFLSFPEIFSYFMTEFKKNQRFRCQNFYQLELLKDQNVKLEI